MVGCRRRDFHSLGPNVYQGGEGDNLSTPRDKINPDKFDATKIAQAVKSARAGYVIFVAKHCGGYCAWQTETTDYSLKTSPWKKGKGDMVAELAMACRKEACALASTSLRVSDIHKVGDGGHAANAEKQKAYNEIYRRQLTEILTNYGPMFEMWFDGGNIVPVNDLIAKLAPEIITFQGRRLNSSRWVGHGTRLRAVSVLEHDRLEGRRDAEGRRRNSRGQYLVPGGVRRFHPAAQVVLAQGERQPHSQPRCAGRDLLHVGWPRCEPPAQHYAR